MKDEEKKGLDLDENKQRSELMATMTESRKKDQEKFLA